MQEYPKALYIGDQKQHQQVIAYDVEHESELRNRGHVDHFDLPHAKTEHEVEALDPSELEQKLAETLEQLALAQARIKELESATSGANPIDYNDLTSDQLRVLLTEQGKTYKARDSKPELIALLVG